MVFHGLKFRRRFSAELQPSPSPPLRQGGQRRLRLAKQGEKRTLFFKSLLMPYGQLYLIIHPISIVINALTGKMWYVKILY
jgi:hypothetical protein